MKKFFILIAIVLFGAIVWFQTKEIWDDKNFYVSKVDDSTRISFEKSSCDFYYDQLSEDERVIFEKILDLYHTKNRVEIILNEPCSVYNISRVADAIRETQKDNYWNFIFPYCFDIDNNWVDVSMDKEDEQIREKTIFKILVQFNSNITYEENSLENISGYEALKELLENYSRSGDFQSVNTQIKSEKEKIINLLKESNSISEKQAVEFFQKWIIQNMKYNYEVEENINTRNRIFFPGDYVQNTSSACVLERKGICGGLLDLMVDLCNEVGIEAYSVKGTLAVQSKAAGPHQWVAIVINKETYYLDPTKDVITQKPSPLYNAEQFYGRESHEYVPLFYFHY